MPFLLDEYELAAATRFRRAMEELLPVREPALQAFPVLEAEAVPTARISVDADTTIEIEPIRREQSIRFEVDLVVRGDLSAVRAVLTAAARDLASARLAFMRQNLDRVTDATGQVRRVRRDMNWDDLMDMIAEMEIGFDARGEPAFLLWPPAAQAKYEDLPPRSDEQEQRWQELMRTKREEADARTGDRRLR